MGCPFWTEGFERMLRRSEKVGIGKWVRPMKRMTRGKNTASRMSEDNNPETVIETVESVLSHGNYRVEILKATDICTTRQSVYGIKVKQEIQMSSLA